MASYGVDPSALKQSNITPVECLLEKLPFSNHTFDAVIMSHVLEHSSNVGLALSEVRRTLKDDGLLCVFVPPHEDHVVGGHVATGWHIGQLMYVLALNGFSVVNGHFAKRGYNVCGFVRKERRPLPKLRCDYGDLKTLSKEGWLPLPITNEDPNIESFYGDLKALNWPWIEALETETLELGPKSKLLRSFVPACFRSRISYFLRRAARALSDPSETSWEIVNPKAFHK
jgi:SAM-dependent methyltransferase